MGINWFRMEGNFTRYAGVGVRTYQRRSGDYHISCFTKGIIRNEK